MEGKWPRRVNNFPSVPNAEKISNLASQEVDSIPTQVPMQPTDKMEVVLKPMDSSVHCGRVDQPSTPTRTPSRCGTGRTTSTRHGVC